MRVLLGHLIGSVRRRMLQPADRRQARVEMTPCTASQRDPRAIARELSQALDRAILRGQWEQADRIAHTAMRLANDHPVLCERLARLRLAQGDAECALHLIETCGASTSSLQLLHVVCLLQLGRLYEAHLELREFATKSCAPVSARLLLGLLEWHSGDPRAAHEAFTRNNRQIEDPHTLIALALINVASGKVEEALRWARRVQHSGAWSPDAPLLQTILNAVGLPFEIQPSAPALDQIEALAVELLANEHVIPALVRAQQWQGDAATSMLLAGAIEQALPDLEDRPAGYLALFDLSECMGDDASAANWLRRGAADCPMSVTLARQAMELDDPQHAAELEQFDVEGLAA